MLIENDIQTLKGSKILFETLKSLGVDTIFGYPGGIVLDIYNELYNQTDIKHILVRHEQSAVHAAEGYARTTGKCGVVLVTSGPGATNTVSGIVNAYLDGSPLLVLTGQVFKNLIGKGAFQEADICDITKSCTKKVYQITSASQIQSTLIEAMNTAMSGKKAPVVVDLVKDIFTQNASYIANLSVNVSGEQPQNYDVSGLLTRIKLSKKPVIVSGGGVAHSKAEDVLYNFAKTLNIPVVDTMMGLGTYPQNDENYFGMIGIFGDNAANELIKEADLIISLGARFNDRITCMFKDVDLGAKFFQIDINPDEIGGFVPASGALVGDIKQILCSMMSLVSGEIDFSDWKNEAQSLKNLNVVRQKTSNMLHSFEVIREIERFTKDKSVIFTSEVGQHQLWACQNLHFDKDRKILVSGGSGTMGFGFPAAIGAAVAKSENPVVCITGDGSFQMGLHELATCVDYDLNVKIMILNNGYLGMVRQLQEKLCQRRYSQTKITNPDFVGLAKSYGIKALRVKTNEEIKPALEEAFREQGTFIIDFVVEPEENL